MQFLNATTNIVHDTKASFRKRYFSIIHHHEQPTIQTIHAKELLLSTVAFLSVASEASPQYSVRHRCSLLAAAYTSFSVDVSFQTLSIFDRSFPINHSLNL